jgi:superfamily II DNA or RNA helicase
MVQDVPFPAADVTAGQALVDRKKIAAVLFSEGTYQVEVREGKGYWPFLQLDDGGRILDCFCTCEEAEKRSACPHLAAAYLKVFNRLSTPLHVRFRDSLWNQLCFIASQRLGYEPSILKPGEEGGYFAETVTSKLLFKIAPRSPKGRSRLETLLWKRAPETEETSLKFSNLHPDELALWRQGRPSHALLYELSFWSDLAKWWMELQEAGEEYAIAFSGEGARPLPRWIDAVGADIAFGLYLAEVNWQRIIPSLTTVQAPLRTFEWTQCNIQKMTYDRETRALHVEFAATAEEAPAVCREEGDLYAVGEWRFLPKKGFFPARADPLLTEPVIPHKKVGALFCHHLYTLKRYLVGEKIHEGGVPARYHLSFDREGALHISCYLFEPGDLQRPRSAYFGPWVYVDEKGFYLLEGQLFSEAEQKVPKDEVSDFVGKHRLWLNGIEGFQTHLSSMESHLNYHVSDAGVLHLDTRVEWMEETGEMWDFGEWLYLKGKGFYAKQARKAGALLRPGLKVESHEISHFIQAHREELEHVSRFFMPSCPLERTGVTVSLTADHRIRVVPDYTYSFPYEGAQARVFGHYVYVPGEGFSEIPPSLRVPEPYNKESVISSAKEPYFVSFELDALRPFIQSIDPKLIKPKAIALSIQEVVREAKAKTGQWVVDLSYETEVGTLDAFSVWAAVHDGQRHLFSSAGLILLKQARFNWLKALPKRRWLKGGKKVRLTTLELIRLTIMEDVREPEHRSRSRYLLEDIKNFRTEQPLILEGLLSQLRPYQETGVKWLWFLYSHGLSGLLCDEMGLGKTHQAMALLAAASHAAPGKHLVVCPTSVIYHWEALLKRFLPRLKVSVFYGHQRTLEDFEAQCDVLLTSYGTLRSEKGALAKLSFDIAIFDEVQIAKNAHSQTHKALRQIDARMRLGLTGTPIENHLLELKALFDVVLPSYLPNDAAFKEFFVHPIERGQDPEKRALLSRLIHPFVLRRKKKEVLLELPDKIEEVAYCPLSDEQKTLYQAVWQESREELIRELADDLQPAPYLHVFALLSTLKQICDHPSLYHKAPEAFRRHQSGKWDLFVELLAEARESGQKVVVFSQYLAMLDIIEAHLREQGIAYAGIRGSTRDRKEEIDRFRDDPACMVFVASLQAAGVGIDLVSASVVIHYDRWWNPAKENQATDRVHRIGQRRGVQVFKMVTKDTVEERIHALIEKKMGLLEEVMGYDDQEIIKSLDRRELLALLQAMDS